MSAAGGGCSGGWGSSCRSAPPPPSSDSSPAESGGAGRQYDGDDLHNKYFVNVLSEGWLREGGVKISAACSRFISDNW